MEIAGWIIKGVLALPGLLMLAIMPIAMTKAAIETVREEVRGPSAVSYILVNEESAADAEPERSVNEALEPL